MPVPRTRSLHSIPFLEPSIAPTLSSVNSPPLLSHSLSDRLHLLVPVAPTPPTTACCVTHDRCAGGSSGLLLQSSLVSYTPGSLTKALANLCVSCPPFLCVFLNSVSCPCTAKTLKVTSLLLLPQAFHTPIPHPTACYGLQLDTPNRNSLGAALAGNMYVTPPPPHPGGRP